MATTILTDETNGVMTTASIGIGSGLNPDMTDRLYEQARSDSGALPWGRDGAHPSLIAWLNAEASGLVRPGSRAVIAGCGLADDAAELAGRGYDVEAFDASPVAVEWARQRHPVLSGSITRADARTPPSRWRRRFDLVVGLDLLAWLDAEARPDVVEGLASLAHPHGCVFSLERGERAGFEGVSLSAEELAGLYSRARLAPVTALDDFEDDGLPPTRWLRGAFRPIR